MTDLTLERLYRSLDQLPKRFLDSALDDIFLTTTLTAEQKQKLTERVKQMKECRVVRWGVG